MRIRIHSPAGGCVPGEDLGEGLAVPVLLHDVEEPVEEVVSVGSPEQLGDEAVRPGVPVERVHRDPRVQGSHLQCF